MHVSQQFCSFFKYFELISVWRSSSSFVKTTLLFAPKQKKMDLVRKWDMTLEHTDMCHLINIWKTKFLDKGRKLNVYLTFKRHIVRSRRTVHVLFSEATLIIYIYIYYRYSEERWQKKKKVTRKNLRNLI